MKDVKVTMLLATDAGARQRLWDTNDDFVAAETKKKTPILCPHCGKEINKILQNLHEQNK